MNLDDSELNARKWIIELLYWLVGIIYMLFFLDGELIKMIFNIAKHKNVFDTDIIFKITKNVVIIMLITKRFWWKYLLLLNYDNEEKKYGIKGEKFALTLKKINMDLKCFRHDLNNMLHAMSGYMFIGDIGGLNTYFKKLMIDVTRVNFLEQITVKLKNNPAILGILIEKYDKTIKKEYLPGKVIKTCGGFLALALLVKPIDKFVEEVLIGKIIDKSIEKRRLAVVSKSLES